MVVNKTTTEDFDLPIFLFSRYLAKVVWWLRLGHRSRDIVFLVLHDVGYTGVEEEG